MPALLDMKGKKFGKLLVLSRGPNDKGGNSKWNVQCDCGVKKLVWGTDLKSGHTTSCGLGKCSTPYVIHGHARRNQKSPTYRSWMAMLSRCRHDNPNHIFYRENCIKVCSRWKHFENFLDDMGERPQGKTLDRVNSYGNYFPENCRWATYREQALNRRKYYVKP